MYELYRLGASLSEVGRTFTLSSARVKTLFVEAGFELRSYEDTMALHREQASGRAPVPGIGDLSSSSAPKGDDPPEHEVSDVATSSSPGVASSHAASYPAASTAKRNHRPSIATVKGSDVQPGDVIRTRTGRELAIQTSKGNGSVRANDLSVFLDPSSMFELLERRSSTGNDASAVAVDVKEPANDADRPQSPTVVTDAGAPDARGPASPAVPAVLVSGAEVRTGDVIRSRSGQTLSIDECNGRGVVRVRGELVYLEPTATFELLRRSSESIVADRAAAGATSSEADVPAPACHSEALTSAGDVAPAAAANPFRDIVAIGQTTEQPSGSGSENLKATKHEPDIATITGQLASSDLADLPIEYLELSVRSYNGLLRAGIRTVRDLGSRRESDLRRIDALGTKSIEEILAAAARFMDEPPELESHVNRLSPAPPSNGGPDEEPIEVLELSLRSHNALRRGGIRTIGQLLTWNSEALRTIPNLGAKSLAEIQAALIQRNRGLATDPSRVTSAERTARLRAERPPRVDPVVDERYRRNEALVSMLREGQAPKDVAKHFGISRARVDQIAQRAGVTVEMNRRAREQRAREESETQRVEIIRRYRDGHTASTIATHLTLRPAQVREILEASLKDDDRIAHRIARLESREPARTTYSDDDLRDAIRRVADSIGDVPSSKQYHEHARRLGLPSLPTVSQRFGSWSNAVVSTGMTPKSSPRREYTRRWSADTCWQALQRLSLELGGPPTVSQYELIATAREDLPSTAIIRQRLGTWSSVTARLLAGNAHPVLARLGLGASADPETIQETVWLSFLADEVADVELAGLASIGLFRWDESYGEPPSALQSDA